MAGRHLIDRLRCDPAQERAALVAGLVAPAASIAPKYFYDALGCALFAAICELDEYYPTRTERAICERYRADIAAAVGRAVQLVDLGAGDGRKAQQWFAPLRVERYVAVDIAAPALDAALDRLGAEARDVACIGVVTDFTTGLDLEGVLAPVPTLFFYPGSSIGNFAPDEALAFLRRVRAAGASIDARSSLLIGVDTKKAKARLDAAYDDALGVTAAFNRNVLRHVNVLLGSDFDVGAFRHRGFYDAAAGRVEMHLEATSAQRVGIGGNLRTFEAGERILTEHSWKYAPAEFTALLRQAGYGDVRCWQDERGDFMVLHAL